MIMSEKVPDKAPLVGLAAIGLAGPGSVPRVFTKREDG